MNHNILHICSINTNGLQQSEKRQRLIEWSKQQQCNILLMQETHFSQNIENKLIQDFKGSIVVKLFSLLLLSIITHFIIILCGSS
jgi:hypothetical protein